jgi:rare lipoprotein A (peptidoglycan hydrolase)
MQTKLRVMAFAVVASLLWITPMFAVSQRATVQQVGKAKKLKTQYIGTASWYGADRQGKKMANGKPFDLYKLTAASWYFPLGTKVRVVNLKNGESVVVTITDRGPNLRLNRVIDLSEAAAAQLDYIGVGLTRIFLYPVPSFETTAATFDSGLVETPSMKEVSGLLTAKSFAEPM